MRAHYCVTPACVGGAESVAYSPVHSFPPPGTTVSGWLIYGSMALSQNTPASPRESETETAYFPCYGGCCRRWLVHFCGKGQGNWYTIVLWHQLEAYGSCSGSLRLSSAIAFQFQKTAALQLLMHTRLRVSKSCHIDLVLTIGRLFFFFKKKSVVDIKNQVI